MTIKEIELLSDMTRANIRFYEAEGLLTPNRHGNGYREYSEKDLETLKKIKLLRALRFSLEEIKRLQAGEQSMDRALAAHLERLRIEELQLRLSRQICETMRSDGVEFATLDAQRYLDTLSKGTLQSTPVPYTDAVPRVQMPWRRYFARMLDLFFYQILWEISLALALNINILARSNGWRLFDSGVAPLLLMLILEPLLLSWFGTTLGKWILGLHVTDNDGCLLTVGEAFSRTWGVLLRGMGLGLPIAQPIVLGWSLWACNKGKTLSWEYETEISLKDDRRWRTAAYIGAYVLLFFALFFSMAFSRLPKNRGDITVAQFCENYNRLYRYYGYESEFYLDEEGRWEETYHPGVVYVDMFETERPEFVFSETDGIMTGVSFSVEQQGYEQYASLYRHEMILCINSFVRAQKGQGLFSKEVSAIVDAISEYPGESFSYSVDGIDITCEVTYSGYHNFFDLGVLFPAEDTQTYYSINFSMQKQDS